MSKKTPTKKKLSAAERAAREKERKRKYAERKKAERAASKKSTTKKSTTEKASKSTTKKASKSTTKKSTTKKSTTEKASKSTTKKSDTLLPGPEQSAGYQKLFAEVNKKGSVNLPLKKTDDPHTMVSRINSAWRRAVRSGRLVLTDGSRIRVLMCGDHLALLKV